MTTFATRPRVAAAGVAVMAAAQTWWWLAGPAAGPLAWLPLFTGPALLAGCRGHCPPARRKA